MADTVYEDAPADMLSLLKSEFLCAADLDGRDHTVTIRGVKVAHIEKNAVVQQSATKGAVKFADGPPDASGKPTEYKPMLLNATNTRAIVRLYGKDPKPWAGKQITIYPTTVEMTKSEVVDGRRVQTKEKKDCIRVRPVAPGAKAEGTK